MASTSSARPSMSICCPTMTSSCTRTSARRVASTRSAGRAMAETASKARFQLRSLASMADDALQVLPEALRERGVDRRPPAAGEGRHPSQSSWMRR